MTADEQNDLTELQVTDNLLSNDPPVLAVWQRARRIERATGVNKPVEGQSPTPPAPVTA